MSPDHPDPAAPSDPIAVLPNTPHRLGFATMLAYGVGQATEGIQTVAFNTFLLFFYQQVVGVPATLAGLALAIALCFDAVTDPLAGMISDNARTRWGRRHPFLLASALPLGASFFFLFNPPAGLSTTAAFLWLTTFAVLVRGAATLFHVPYLALGAEIARDYDQRSTLFTLSTLFLLAGATLSALVAYIVFFPTSERYDPGLLDPSGYFGFGLFFGAAMALTIVACVAGTRHEIPRLSKPSTNERFAFGRLLRQMREAFGNHSFRALFFGMTFATVIVTAEQVLQPYVGVHFWGLRTEQLALLPLAALFGILLSPVLTPWFTRTLDKKLTLITTAALAIVNANVSVCLRLSGVSWFPSNDSPWILILVTFHFCVGMALATVLFATINSMFADIADEHELEVGERREGVIYAARSFALKATGALGTVFGGLLLDLIAFPERAGFGTVPADTVWRLGLVAGPGAAVFTFFGLVLYMGYRLDRQRHAEIVAAIEQRRAG